MSVPPVPRPATSASTRGERLGDLGARALVVRAGVGLVRVLEGHEVARVALRQLAARAARRRSSPRDAGEKTSFAP